jgi:hypothetical protein
MMEITRYVADDGTEFETEEECMSYELKPLFEALGATGFKTFNRYYESLFHNNSFTDLQNMHFLNIPNIEAKKLLITIIDKMGYDSRDILYGITEPGIYYFDEVKGKFIPLSWMENQVKTIKSMFKAE